LESNVELNGTAGNDAKTFFPQKHYLIYHREYGYAKALELEKDFAAYHSGG
jgi:hypothetical protein